MQPHRAPTRHDPASASDRLGTALELVDDPLSMFADEDAALPPPAAAEPDLFALFADEEARPPDDARAARMRPWLIALALFAGALAFLSVRACQTVPAAMSMLDR